MATLIKILDNAKFFSKTILGEVFGMITKLGRMINNILITQGDLVEVIINKQPHGFGKFEVVHRNSALRLKEIEANWSMILEEDSCLEDSEEMKIIGNIF